MISMLTQLRTPLREGDHQEAVHRLNTIDDLVRTRVISMQLDLDDVLKPFRTIGLIGPNAVSHDALQQPLERLRVAVTEHEMAADF